MKRYLFVVNPVSGGQDKSLLIEGIHSSFEEMDHEVILTSGNDDRANLQEKMAEYGPDVVVIAGGDGTINQLVEPIIDGQKTLGIIPSGSANGLAKDLGISYENALDVIKRGNTSCLDIVSMDKGCLMVHMADFGLNASLVKRYEEQDRSGFIGYAISALQEIPSINETFKAEIILEDKSQVFETSYIALANARMYGTGYNINPFGSLDDQKIEICILKDVSPPAIISGLFMTREKHESLFDVIATKKGKIRCTTPIDFQSDGEYIGKLNEISFEVLDQQVKVLT